ncbi:MAG: alpha-1,2-fucosyltransferase [Candidatus Entotheonellia bacterium]
MPRPEALSSGSHGFGGVIHLLYHGRLGNNLFQYCFGRVLAEELQCALLARPIPGFEHATSLHLESACGVCEREIGLRQERADSRIQLQEKGGVSHLRFDEILPCLRSGKARKRITIDYGCFLHVPFYRDYVDQIRHRWLRIPDRFRIHENALTIHIRSGDIWQENISKEPHDSYCALPFSFYETIVKQRAWQHIHVVTEDCNDPMVRKLSHCYGASIVSGTAFEDFSFIKSSKNIVLAVSTFSWFAAFLSQARTIYYPLAGLFHRGIRPDVNLQVNEPRYCYCRVYPDDQFRDRFKGVFSSGKPSWKGTQDVRQFLLVG